MDAALWARSGGDLLTGVFGYVPTLHDARVTSLAFSPSEGTVTVRYEDLPDGAAQNVAVEIAFRFARPRRVEIPWGENSLLEARLREGGGGIGLDLLFGSGVWGTVEGDDLRIVLLQVNAPSAEENGMIQVTFA